MPREFEIRREVELPASPEQLWGAIATGPGNAAWLFPTEIAAEVGGTSADGSTVTVWDPPRHLAACAEDDRARLALPRPDPMDALVDYLAPQFIDLRTADGLYRFFGRNAWGMPVGLGHHLFAEGIDRDETRRAWRAWLEAALAEA